MKNRKDNYIDDEEQAIMDSLNDVNLSQIKTDEKNMQTSLEATFSNYKNTDGLQLPYSILLSIKGKKEGYLKLKYRFLSIK